MVGVWTVMVVLCLAGHAHAQLGETDQDATRGDVKTDAEGDQLKADGNEEEEGGGQGTQAGLVVRTRTPRRWKPVSSTYQGCLHEDNFTSVLMFVNLTAASNGSMSPVETCYRLCLNKVPFSQYLALGPATNGSVDSCGCLHDFNRSHEVDDAECDGQTLNVYWMYCGPANFDCFNGAPAGVGVLSLPLLASILLLLTFC